MRDGRETEFITDRQWDARAAYLERRNLERHGWSLTRTAIARRANDHIIDIRTGSMLVYVGWRKAMDVEEKHGR